MSDPVQEPETYNGIVIGARYKLLEPTWSEVFGQGERPSGMRINDFEIPWNTPVVASVTCEHPGELKPDGTYHVRAEIIDQLYNVAEGTPRQFRKLPS
jgi:hypothetical protein